MTETLATLSLPVIMALAAGLTVLRLSLIRLPSATARVWAEIAETALIALVLVFLLIRPFIGQANYIPSPSMAPTLLGKNGQGDRILVNKFLYRVHPPRADDVVVFVAPPAALKGSDEAGNGNVDFIKRLIGLPGDRLQVVHGQVVIDGTSYSHGDVRNALRSAGIFGSDALAETNTDFLGDHHAKFVPDGVLADGKLIGKSQLATIMTGMPSASVTIQPGYVVRNGRKLSEPFIAEDPDYDLTLFNGQPLKHDYSMTLPDPEYRLNGEPIPKADYEYDLAHADGRVPARSYVMMGDNRNDSRDSTEWGPLDGRRVVGRAQVIFWPPGRMHAIP